MAQTRTEDRMQTRRSVALLAVVLVSALSAAAGAEPARDRAVAVSVQKDVLPAVTAPAAVDVFALEAVSVSYRAIEMTAVRLALNSFQPVSAFLAERGSRTTSLRATRMPTSIHRLTRQRHLWRNRLPATDTAYSRRLQV